MLGKIGLQRQQGNRLCLNFQGDIERHDLQAAGNVQTALLIDLALQANRAFLPGFIAQVLAAQTQTREFLHRVRTRRLVFKAEGQIINIELGHLSYPGPFVFQLGIGLPDRLQHRRADPLNLPRLVAQHAGSRLGVGQLGNVDAVRRQIDPNALHRHLRDAQTFTEIDLVTDLGNLDRISQPAIQLAHPGVQIPHLALHRRQRRLIVPAQQAIAHREFIQRPGQWLAGLRFRALALCRRSGHFFRQGQHIQLSLPIH